MRTINRTKLKNSLIAYLFMAPALIILIAFVFYPIIYSLPLSLFDYSVVGETRFIGLENFKRVLNDKLFWIAIKNSVVFVLVVPPIQLIAILLAILVNKKIPGIKFFRVLYYIPVVTSMVAVSIIWGWIFNPNGVLNTFLLQNSIISKPILWLDSSKLALPSLMFITMWQGVGYYMMIYLAGLQSIPKEMEEAAMIDGANKLQVLFKVKIPLLKPYVWFCTLMSTLSAVGVFDVVFVLTKGQGGPNYSTLVANLYSYNKAFTDFSFGYSASIGLLVSIITTTLSIFVFIYGKKGGMSHYDG